MKGEIRVYKILNDGIHWWSPRRWEALEHVAAAGWVVAYGRTRRGARRALDRKRGRR